MYSTFKVFHFAKTIFLKAQTTAFKQIAANHCSKEVHEQTSKDPGRFRILKNYLLLSLLYENSFCCTYTLRSAEQAGNILTGQSILF